MTNSERSQRIEAVRSFSRFYTAKIGALHEGLLDSPFSLTEARVIYELAHHESTTATTLVHELDLDAGYLSRLLRNFEKRGLIHRQPAATDARQNVISLTKQGEAAFAKLNERSQNAVGAMLDEISVADQQQLVGAMDTIQTVLGNQPPPRVPYVLRPHQPGDIGWAIQRHAIVYTQEYGWDETFEAFVAEAGAKFIQGFNPKRERCWIAEKDGENVGSVFLVEQSEEVAKLRMLIVEPKARGLGIGKRLVDECIRFARLKGYRRIVLWTSDILTTATRIYGQAGFRLREEERELNFGLYLMGQTWELEL